MFRSGFLLSLMMALGLLAVGGPGLLAQEVTDQQYKLKRAYLYNFARYVEWPQNAGPGDDKTFVIAVLGPNPFGNALDSLAGEMVQDRKIVVRLFASAKDYQPCHILFLSAEADEKAEEKTVNDRLKAALTKTKGSPVLVVSDTEGLAQKGTIINFSIVGNSLKLEINPAAATRAGLKINPRLLALPSVIIVKDSAASKP